MKLLESTLAGITEIFEDMKANPHKYPFRVHQRMDRSNGDARICGFGISNYPMDFLRIVDPEDNSHFTAIFPIMHPSEIVEKHRLANNMCRDLNRFKDTE